MGHPNLGSLLLFVYVDVLRVDYAFLLRLLRSAIGARLRTRSGLWTRLRGSCALRRGCLVHLLGELVRRSGQLLARGVHCVFVSAFERLLCVRQRIFHVLAFATRDLV